MVRKIELSNSTKIPATGPVLIAANHPNSFLDAIVLSMLFPYPIWSLARGDAFKRKWVRKMLTKLKMLPVYRVSEGVENLSTNYDTFQQCQELFKQEESVLIFSEGLCVNEWHLRPLKKGTARLAISSWEQNIPLNVLPIGINYSSFRKMAPVIHVHIGETFSGEDIMKEPASGLRLQQFNRQLYKQLSPLVYELPPNDYPAQAVAFKHSNSLLKKLLLVVPAIIGFLLHAPYYMPVKTLCKKVCGQSVHYDSIYLALLLIGYPLYLFLLFIPLFIYTGLGATLLFLIAPFTLWSFIQLKYR